MEEINIYSSEMQVGVYKGVKNVDYLYKYKSFDNLLVMFNGAVDVSRAKYPVFQRKSFIEYINANILIINDNTLTEDNGLSLGWYQGAPEWNLQSDIVFLIKKYLMALEIKNESLFLYGSSAGGFIASIIATHFRGSTAIVNNPQVDVLKFFDSHVNNLLAYYKINREYFKERFYNRYSLINLIRSLNYCPKIVYYQNISDTFHYDNHFLYFLKEISVTFGKNILALDRIDVKLYDNPYQGHNPLDMHDTILILNRIIHSCV